jgi:hypothetical protein
LPRPALATETLAEAEHAVLELTSLLDAEVSVTQIILEALEARVVGLKVVRLGRLLVAGWVRGCARLYGVHSGHPFSVGRVPGSSTSCGTISLCDALILEDLLIFVNHTIDVCLSFVVR